MSAQLVYLTNELLRYFPSAKDVRVKIHPEDETFTATIVDREDTIYEFHMEIGSDDDWYAFYETDRGYLITIPFEPNA